MLRMLSDLDASALLQLARFAHLTAEYLDSGRRRIRTGVFVENNRLYEIRTDNERPLLGDLLAQHLGERGGPHTRRMFRSLKAQGLADDVTHSPGSVPGVDAIAIEKDVVDILVAILPNNPPPPVTS